MAVVELGRYEPIWNAGNKLKCYKTYCTVLPAKEDLWQSLSYVASRNGGPGSLDSYGWLRGERRACHSKVITRPASLKVPVWQLRVVSINNDPEWSSAKTARALSHYDWILLSCVSLPQHFVPHSHTCLGIIFEWNYYSKNLKYRVIQKAAHNLKELTPLQGGREISVII